MTVENKKSVYCFKVTLDTNFKSKDKEKPYRKVALLENQSLSTLARAIVLSFDFDFDHCYGFYDNFQDPYKSKEMYELFTDLGEDPVPGALGVERVRVARAFPNIGKKLRFLFDYGDNWLFAVELLDITTKKENTKYSQILKKVGQAPEQYPQLEEDEFKEEAKDAQKWFHDDCKLCQDLKNSGVEMQWFPHEPKKNTRLIN